MKGLSCTNASAAAGEAFKVWHFSKSFPSIANQGRTVKAGLWHGL